MQSPRFGGRVGWAGVRSKPKKGSQMSEISATCPKCQGVMVQGFVPDFAHSGVIVEVWVEGPPQKSFWVGTKIPVLDKLPIATFRCETCGFLESYARKEFAAA